MKKKVEKKVVKPKVKVVIAEENTPITVDVDLDTATNNTYQGGDVIISQESTSVPEQTVILNVPRKTYFYPVPETKEDYLALHRCLKDLGVNSTGDLEVRASRL